MRTKLSLAMLAIAPFMVFGQTSKSKMSVHPTKIEKKVNQNLAVRSTLAAPAAFCTPVLDCSDGDLITNVTFGTINNTTSCSTDGYGDYTAMQTEVVPGNTYPLSVAVGDGWFERVSLFIDYNNNDTFDADEFIGEVGEGSSTGGTLTRDVTIPADLAPGSYRMRVMVIATGSQNPVMENACVDNEGGALDGNYGESEDYTLVVAATGCLTAPNGQYPTATFTPNCNGAAQNITAVAWTGEYSKVNLQAGVQYTFGVSNQAYYITISDENGTEVLAGGTGSVTFTPATAGVYRFYSHLDADCGSSNVAHARTIMCGTPPPPPVEPEYGCEAQTYNAGEPSLANNTANGTAPVVYAVANDFFVPANTNVFTFNTLKAHMVPLQGQADLTGSTYDIVIMEDNNKAPGTVLHTLSGISATSVTSLPDTFAGYATFEVTFDMGGYELNGDLTEAKRYWVSIHTNSAANSGVFWIGYNHTPTFNTQYNFISQDGGATFAPITSTDVPNTNFDSFMTVDATCTQLGINEVNNKKVSFYPNPVKDILTVTSKQKIETVHVYNVAGQKMNISSKLNNNQIDMSKLAPGVYIISTITADGQNESFKVIKK